MLMLDKVKKALRVKSASFDDEIQEIIYACIADLRLVGVGIPFPDTEPAEEEPQEEQEQNEVSDALFTRAVVLYAKANFGFNEESEKYQKTYDNLKCALSLAGEINAVD